MSHDDTTDEPEALPWAQREGESGVAYEAFDHYLSLGPSRSIDKAWRASEAAKEGSDEAQNKLKRAPAHWRGWSAEHGWVERVKAWDQHCAELRREKRERVVTKVYDTFLDNAELAAEQLLDVMLDPDAKAHQVKAAEMVLAYSGVSVPKEIHVTMTPAERAKMLSEMLGVDEP